MPDVEGVGPEVEHITLEGGGQRSNSPYAFDQLPPRAMFKLARRFAFGMEKGYEEGNWKKLPLKSFIAHGLQHVFAFMVGDTSEGDPGVHLEAAMWNFTAAVEVYYLSKENPQMDVVCGTMPEREIKAKNPMRTTKYEWKTNAEAMAVLRHTIQRNKVQGHDDENTQIEYALQVLIEKQNDATAEIQHKV